MSTATAPVVEAAGTNDTAGARRIAAAFAAAHSEGRVALIPYVVAGYPDAATSLRIAVWYASTVGVAEGRAHLSAYGTAAAAGSAWMSVICAPPG